MHGSRLRQPVVCADDAARFSFAQRKVYARVIVFKAQFNVFFKRRNARPAQNIGPALAVFGRCFQAPALTGYNRAQIVVFFARIAEQFCACIQYKGAVFFGLNKGKVPYFIVGFGSGKIADGKGSVF